MIGTWIKCLVAVAALAPALASAERYNLQTPQTIIVHEIYDLHTLILVICGVIFVAVFGAMIYSIIKHRQAAGHKAAQFHPNVMVEIAWTIIPFLILIGVAYPATKTVISMHDTSSPSRGVTTDATVSHHPSAQSVPG
jgi:cytochrome c oxidase subunit II